MYAALANKHKNGIIHQTKKQKQKNENVFAKNKPTEAVKYLPKIPDG